VVNFAPPTALSARKNRVASITGGRVGVLEKRLFFFAVIGTPDCSASSLVSIKTTLPHNVIIIRPIAEHC